MQRRRSVPHTFEENIAAEKAKLEAQVAQLKPGPHERTGCSRKSASWMTASHMNEWLTSPGLRPAASLEEVRPPQLAAFTHANLFPRSAATAGTISPFPAKSRQSPAPRSPAGTLHLRKHTEVTRRGGSAYSAYGPTYPFQMPTAGHERAALASGDPAGGRAWFQFLCVRRLPRLHPASFHPQGNRQTPRRGLSPTSSVPARTQAPP